MTYELKNNIANLEQTHKAMLGEIELLQVKADKMLDAIKSLKEADGQVIDPPATPRAKHIKVDTPHVYAGMEPIAAVIKLLGAISPTRPNIKQVYESLLLGGYEFRAELPPLQQHRGLSRTIHHAIKIGNDKFGMDKKGRLYLK